MSEAKDLIDIKAQNDQSTALTPMAMIDRALMSGANIETLDKLMDLQERWQKSEAKSAYDADMASMQSELPIIEKKQSGDRGRWKFAGWADIKREINPIMSRHGFAVTHRIETGDNELTVTAICSHRKGHREETSLPLPYDTSGSKNNVQARGSSIQYGTRYTGCAVLGIAVGGEDTDGQEPEHYDISEWRHKIRNAESAEILTQIAQDLKSKSDIPQSAMVEIRSAWSKRSKELAGDQ